MNKQGTLTCRETAQLTRPMPLSLHTMGLQQIFPQKMDNNSPPLLKSRLNASESEVPDKSTKSAMLNVSHPESRHRTYPMHFCLRTHLENQKCLNTGGGIFVSFSGDDAAVTPQYMGDCHAYCQRYYFPPERGLSSAVAATASPGRLFHLLKISPPDSFLHLTARAPLAPSSSLRRPTASFVAVATPRERLWEPDP